MNTLKKASKAKAASGTLDSSTAANFFKGEAGKITAKSESDRAKALLVAMNKTLDKQGLPRIKNVAVAEYSNSPTEGTLASYDPGTSTMTINKKSLSGDKLPTVALVAVYHEAVHSQQAYYVARYLASKKSPMTAQEIKAVTGYEGSIVDRAVQDNKTKAPLTDKQVSTAKSIYESKYVKNKTLEIDGATYIVTETQKVKYELAQAEQKVRDYAEAYKKNPNIFNGRQAEVDKVLQDYNRAYKAYQALPHEEEAFRVQKLISPTLQSSSSQYDGQLAEFASGNSTTQTVSARNTGSETLDKMQTSSNMANEADTLGSNSQFSATNENITSSIDVSKVVTLLRENADSIKQQYGLDVTTDEGLGKAVMQYWKENNLDPKILKEQLPNLKNTEISSNSASSSTTSQSESRSDVSKVIALLKENTDAVKQQYGLDVTTSEGLGKAVMQYWKENNLDPKTLKKQLPDIKGSDINAALAAAGKAKTAETSATKQVESQR